MVNEAKIFREKEKEEIVELLLRDGESRSVYVISVISIIELAVWARSFLQHHFDLKVWTSVSEDIDIIRVTMSIRMQLSTISIGIKRIWRSN